LIDNPETSSIPYEEFCNILRKEILMLKPASLKVGQNNRNKLKILEEF
jgi:hypothetical protein